MGYCMSLSDADFAITRDNQTNAFLALKALLATDATFKWVDKTIVTCNLEETMMLWGWLPAFDDTPEDIDTLETFLDVIPVADIIDISFERDKLGDEKIMFDTIAPFVKTGSYLQLLGEEGETWRWVFIAGKCYEIDPVWPMPNFER